MIIATYEVDDDTHRYEHRIGELYGCICYRQVTIEQ